MASYDVFLMVFDRVAHVMPGGGNVSVSDKDDDADDDDADDDADDDDDDDADQSVTSSLTRSDAGLYTCVVKNIAGHVSHNISLFIEGLTLLHSTPALVLPISATLSAVG